MTVALAIDVGGTKVEVALVRGDGTIVAGSRFRTQTGPTANAESLRSGLRELVTACAELQEWRLVASAGIASAGPVDLGNGTISPLNMPSLRGFAIVEEVREITQLTDVTLRLDGTCIAMAELWLGAARGVDNAIVIVVSTGVGGGICSGGRLIAGRTGNAGHVGQLIIDSAAVPPQDATVEGIASGPATVAWAKAHGWNGDTGEELSAAYGVGDPIAVAAVERSAAAVGTGLVNAATLLDLQLAVIGGGFSFVANDYVERIQQAVTTRAVHDYAKSLRVVRAQLAGDAPLVGAAALVHRRDLLG